MTWLVLALASAALFGTVSILDKILLNRFLTNVRTFNFMLGLLQFLMIGAALFLADFHSHPANVWVLAFASGLLQGTSLVIMFRVMSTQDVTRVVPVMSTFPVFVAILAVVFLSEQLSIWHWMAILVTVAGAALISMRGAGASGLPGLGPSFFALLLGSMTFASGNFLAKLVLEDLEVWELFVVRSSGLGTAALVATYSRRTLADARAALNDPIAVGFFVLTEGVLVFIALGLTLLAIDLGPVSLVSTVMATRPLFVFVMGLLLSTRMWRVMDESMDRQTLVTKVVSTAMVVGGVGAISLL